MYVHATVVMLWNTRPARFYCILYIFCICDTSHYSLGESLELIIARLTFKTDFLTECICVCGLEDHTLVMQSFPERA